MLDRLQLTPRWQHVSKGRLAPSPESLKTSVCNLKQHLRLSLALTAFVKVLAQVDNQVFVALPKMMFRR